MSEVAAAPTQHRTRAAAAGRGWLAAVLVWPWLLLWPCLFGGRTFLPYDLAQFPPASLALPTDALAAMRAESNFDITETPVWFVPELQRARRTIVEEHALPNWHPTARTGTALLPHGHDAMLYPFVWPALFARDPAAALGWVALANLTVAGLLMFGFLRALALAPAAAALGALALCASTTLCANAHNYSRLSSLVWLPGMLWGLRAAADALGARRRRALCLFAACFALTWIGGFPPFAMPATLLACGYAGVLALAELRVDRARALRTGAAFLLAIALGAALAAAYVLPAFAFFGTSARSLTPDLRHISQVGFDWFGLWGYLAPDLFGRPDLVASLPYDRSPLVLLLAHREQYGGGLLPPSFNATEYAVYAGAFVLWLAVLALGRRGARHRWFPAASLVLYWAMAAFVLPLGYLFLLPGIQVVPPLRFLGPCCVLLAWLAAQGLDLVLRGAAGRRLALGTGLALTTAVACWLFADRTADGTVFRDWQLAARIAARYGPLTPDPAAFTPEVVERQILSAPDGGDYVARGAALLSASSRHAAGCHAAAALLLALFLVGQRRGSARGRALLAGAALLVTGAELWHSGRTFDRGIARAHSDWTPVHEFLAAQRSASAESGGFMIARAAPLAPDGSLPGPSALPPGRLGPHDVRDLQVYTYFDARSAQPLQALFDAVPGAKPVDLAKGYVASCLADDAGMLGSPLLDLLGLRYVLADVPLAHAGARVPLDWRPEHGEFYVYERPHACPRAFVVDRLEALPADADVVRRLVDPAFAPRAVAFATQQDLAAAGVAAPAPAAGAAARAVRFVQDHATAIELAVAAGPPSWLVLADTFAPGWHATVDGVAAPILRVDHALRAVAVPAGACTVGFAYTAPRQFAGYAISALALAVLAAVWWRARRTARDA